MGFVSHLAMRKTLPVCEGMIIILEFQRNWIRKICDELQAPDVWKIPALQPKNTDSPEIAKLKEF